MKAGEVEKTGDLGSNSPRGRKLSLRNTNASSDWPLIRLPDSPETESEADFSTLIAHEWSEKRLLKKIFKHIILGLIALTLPMCKLIIKLKKCKE